MGFFVAFLHIYHHDIIQWNVDWIYQFEIIEEEFVKFLGWFLFELLYEGNEQNIDFIWEKWWLSFWTNFLDHFGIGTNEMVKS